MLCAVPVLPGEKCIIPECKRRRYTDGSVTHWYCSKSHAEEGGKRGIFRELLQFGMKLNQNHCSVSISLSISILLCLSVCLSVASATDPKDQCDLPNCTRPKAVEANGYKYNHCCRDHALKDGEGGN